jgi:hypothetical protein
VTREAVKRDRWWEALWSYRENAPMTGTGEWASVIPFDVFLGQLGLGEPKAAEVPEITDEEIERLMKAGRMGWIPPEG